MGFGILLPPPSPFAGIPMPILLVVALIASPLLGLASLLVLLLYHGLLVSSCDVTALIPWPTDHCQPLTVDPYSQETKTGSATGLHQCPMSAGSSHNSVTIS